MTHRLKDDSRTLAHAHTLSAERLGRRDRRRGTWLFRHLSLTVEPGARLAIVGSTGSGKTLLLRALALLDPLDEGELRWRGQRIAAADTPAYRRQVLYLHQHAALFPGTVEGNLRAPFALRIHRRAAFDRPRVLGLLDAFGRDETFLQRPQRELSGGERQIVALIRALQLDPAVLLCDEATSAMDAETALAAEAVVARWLDADRSRGCLWVSHNAEQVERVARRVLVLHEGNLREPG